MTQPNKIKIAVVDDHELFRTGLLTHLSIYPDLEFVINVESGAELLSSLENQSVDVILLDINLPDISGIEIIKTLREKNQIVKIIMLTGYDLPSYVTGSIEANANGYLIKSSKASEIYHSILTVLSEGSYYNEQVKNILASDVIIRHQISLSDNANRPTFSAVDMKLLRLIRDGKTSEEIGKELHKSKRTIDEYRSKLMKKTNTHNSFELLYYCIANKVFDKHDN